ncbi:ABC transporter substrate-binding protein [Clostridium tyrobutyricum]|jgi:NitT/TauT family transport system substrate-binding protein|uniref:ABC-type nitrate/sulfonate/bicarbonate transport systems, periplasmic components n=2 Tax=Clostridia TaxID=186801 RepID=W6NFB9_CLOTY|nr:ABC transporter substrate-binding protein [Clostridium tyrobutyricum]AND84747.1 ABC transporter substrate-binding protein [Clostridium tyrobutyricum]ANP69338.1 ABC transporter substrate-binding protein [Clostridium tyrobutyricum]MBV4425992.1 ABC transporter substrate-binding protein [Clostridium tyrobutyricum]MBV4427376.1 ABC transporter substrate-binding protein [Clostridium tyrobutyricum]MBV4430474.1 ABC transporter substrate-binding protein [Clostridium tyrobutyricum]
MNKITRIVAALLLVAAVPTLASCGKSTSTSSTQTGKYKYGKLEIEALGGGVCGAPAYIAKEKGFFAKEGFDVTLVSGTFEDQKTGLASGKFTVTNGDFQFFPSVQQGLDIKVIGGLHKGCIKLVVPPNSPIKTAKDLKGKKIGVDEIGGTPMAITSVVLANHNIDPTKGVKWVPYPLDQLTKAVDKGDVDAFAAWDPFATLAEKNNNYRVVTDIAQDPLFKGKSCCFLYASNKEIKNNPEKIAALVRAYKAADEWISKHPEETAKIELDKKYISGGDLKLITELIKSYDFEYTTDAAKDDVKYFVGQLNKTGFLKKNTDPTKFTNDVYYDALGSSKNK